MAGNEQGNAISNEELLRQKIADYYRDIPTKLESQPDIQERCLTNLVAAQRAFEENDFIQCRLYLTRIEIEMNRAKGAKTSFAIMVTIVYMFAVFMFAAVYAGAVWTNIPAEELNKSMFMGIPEPIWFWAVIGSFTSMLLRAGYFPFQDKTQAFRWLLFRPIVGVVMGVLAYLMVIAGLIVFAGKATPQTPELLWVISFVGSFSDTLSINLLQRILGRYETVEAVIQNDHVNDNKF